MLVPVPRCCARKGVHVYIDGACVFCRCPPAAAASPPAASDDAAIDAALAEFVAKVREA